METSPQQMTVPSSTEPLIAGDALDEQTKSAPFSFKTLLRMCSCSSIESDSEFNRRAVSSPSGRKQRSSYCYPTPIWQTALEHLRKQFNFSLVLKAMDHNRDWMFDPVSGYLLDFSVDGVLCEHTNFRKKLKSVNSRVTLSLKFYLQSWRRSRSCTGRI